MGSPVLFWKSAIRIETGSGTFLIHTLFFSQANYNMPIKIIKREIRGAKIKGFFRKRGREAATVSL
jgi:hypothetical protein